MKHKQMVVDPDQEVIDMVNGAATRRKALARRRKLAEKRKQESRAFWQMMREACGSTTLGVMSFIALSQEPMTLGMAVLTFFVCTIWSVLRVDRYVRR